MLDTAQPSVKEMMTRTGKAKGRKPFRHRLVWVGVLLFAFAAIMTLTLGREPLEPKFQTQKVGVGDLIVTVTATGNLAATNEVEVGCELSGIITSMTADYNDTVKIGQPLVYLDASKYEATVLKSRAEVASVEADYKEARATRKASAKKVQRYELTRRLTHGKLPAMADLESAQAELECAVAAEGAALAAISKAKATLQSDEADLKKTVVYSPINGIVLSREVEPGQTVAASFEAPVLYTLAEDLRRMELQVDVDEADVGQVKEGQTAQFSVDAYPDRTFEAQITQVRYGAETSDDGVVTYKAVMEVKNPNLLLRPGMTATADITVQKIEHTLRVPNAALRFSPVEPTAGPENERSLLKTLLPGPPRHPKSRKSTEMVPGDQQAGRSRVWIVKNNRPVPIEVKKIATDGVMTAVTSLELKEGMALIVNTLATKVD